MINKHILKFLRKTKKVLNTPSIDKATLTAIDGEIRLITNGIPSTILIQYKGTVFFESLMPIYAKVVRGKNTILITNIFKATLPELIFNYGGNLEIDSCKIMSFNNHSILATIENKQQGDIVNISETKFEDDTATLHAEGSIKTPRVRRGLYKKRIDMSKFDEFGKIQKYGTREKEEIFSAIIKTIPSLIDSRKGKIAKPTISKSTVSKPTISKPTISKPTVSRPTISRPTVTAPKIEKPKGGKY